MKSTRRGCHTMSRWHVTRRWTALVIAFAISVTWAPVARAQEVMVPVPGRITRIRAREALHLGAATQRRLANRKRSERVPPFRFPVAAISTCKVPLSEDAAHLPPTENWSVQRTTPHSPGGGPDRSLRLVFLHEQIADLHR